MPDSDPSTHTKHAANATGGRRNTANGNAQGSDALAVPGGLGESLSNTTPSTLGSKPEGFGLDGEDVKGSLKIHIKLNLEADIRVIAKVKGDIAIGLL